MHGGGAGARAGGRRGQAGASNMPDISASITSHQMLELIVINYKGQGSLMQPT